MAGKYEQFRKLYPKAPIDGDRIAMINIVLDTSAFPDSEDHTRVRDLNNTQLQELYVQARKAKEEIESRLESVCLQVDALVQLFCDRFEEADITSMKFANGVTIGTSFEPYPTVIDKDALHGWIRSTKQDDLFTVNYQTLASVVKAAILEGKEIPPGVDVFMKTKLSARGLKTQQGEQ